MILIDVIRLNPFYLKELKNGNFVKYNPWKDASVKLPERQAYFIHRYIVYLYRHYSE